jgi:hypothetical protein
VRKPTFRTTALVFVGLLVVIQLIPVSRDNPPPAGGPRAAIAAPAPVISILRRACADCHSHDTVWPWYSHVAPVSWLVASDVHEGRRHLNLSEWAGYTPADKLKKLALLSTEVQEGEMPLWYYLPLHPLARLTPEDVSTLMTWADSASGNEPGTTFSDPSPAVR